MWPIESPEINHFQHDQQWTDSNQIDENGNTVKERIYDHLKNVLYLKFPFVMSPTENCSIHVEAAYFH